MVWHCILDVFIILYPILAPKYKLHETGTWTLLILSKVILVYICYSMDICYGKVFVSLWGLLFRQPDKCWHILFPKCPLQCPFSIFPSSFIVFPAAGRVYCFISYGLQCVVWFWLNEHATLCWFLLAHTCPSLDFLLLEGSHMFLLMNFPSAKPILR